jgi:predicted transcriptional regulator
LSDTLYWMDDSILDPFQQKKRKRISSIKEMLKKLEKVELKEFMGKVSVNCGINKATVREYLEALEIAGYVEIKNGTVLWKQET